MSEISGSLWIIIPFILYLIVMLLIGWYFYTRTKTVDDYALAGRGLNSWVTSLSAQASDMSGWIMMGLPGYAFIFGSEAAWMAIGLFVGTYINWKFIAKKLRIETEKYEAITLPMYFENKYKDRKHLLRIVSAVFIVVFFLIYTSSGFVAGAKLFTTVFEITYHKALLLTVLIVVGYTFMGGFGAVSWTDFIQGILMFMAIVAVPVVTWLIISRQGASGNNLQEGYFSLFGYEHPNRNINIVILSNLAWGLGYFGQPHILARFMAIKKASLIKRSRKIAITWVLISLIASLLAGIVGRLFFTEGIDDPERVFLLLASVNFPPYIAGIILAAILAAIMSTADSQLLVASTSVSEDLYKILAKGNGALLGKRILRVSRLALVLVALLSLIFAWNPENTVLGLVSYAWAGFGACFGPLIILSLYWKKMTKQGAVAAIVAGGVAVIVWKNLSGGIFELYEIVPAFLISGLSAVIFSRFSVNASTNVDN